MTEEEAIKFSIAFAISKTSLRPRSKNVTENGQDRAAAAKIIYDYLKLCGYKIIPGPGVEPHSTHR